MYHASGFAGGEIFESIDLSTLAVTDIPHSGGYFEALGLTYAGGGSFFVSDLSGGLFTITTGGTVTFVGDLGYRAKGLTLVADIAEPSVLGLVLAGGGLGLGLARRRRRD